MCNHASDWLTDWLWRFYLYFWPDSSMAKVFVRFRHTDNLHNCLAGDRICYEWSQNTGDREAGLIIMSINSEKPKNKWNAAHSGISKKTIIQKQMLRHGEKVGEWWVIQDATEEAAWLGSRVLARILKQAIHSFAWVVCVFVFVLLQTPIVGIILQLCSRPASLAFAEKCLSLLHFRSISLWSFKEF